MPIAPSRIQTMLAQRQTQPTGSTGMSPQGEPQFMGMLGPRPPGSGYSTGPSPMNMNAGQESQGGNGADYLSAPGSATLGFGKQRPIPPVMGGMEDFGKQRPIPPVIGKQRPIPPVMGGMNMMGGGGAIPPWSSGASPQAGPIPPSPAQRLLTLVQMMRQGQGAGTPNPGTFSGNAGIGGVTL